MGMIHGIHGEERRIPRGSCPGLSNHPGTNLRKGLGLFQIVWLDTVYMHVLF